MFRVYSLILAIALIGTSYGAPEKIAPEAVLVLYNSSLKESKELAEFYAAKRGIQKSHVVGLPMPEEQEITRVDYEEKIKAPLAEVFDLRSWWERKRDMNGILTSRVNSIRFLVCVRGVPVKIKRDPIKKDSEGNTIHIEQGQQDEASVDSELTLLGVEKHRIESFAKNPYFEKEQSFASFDEGTLVLVGRIDGPSVDVCKERIEDALEAEEKGLWGRAYLDLALKGKAYEMGDHWLENILEENQKLGIPTVVERSKDTYLTHYPMNDAIVYFGWYTGGYNGPFLKKDFKFKKGAIGVHLHSFSASNIRKPDGGWVGPLIEAGAAATLGNVYEPYLPYTHHFDIFYKRLLKGYTVVEAAAMAMPVLSWQGVVVGDPLYRPFAALNNFVEEADEEDRAYMAMRVAKMRWGSEATEYRKQLEDAAKRIESGIIYETLGLQAMNTFQYGIANTYFAQAQNTYADSGDQLRQHLHRIAAERVSGQRQVALSMLEQAYKKYSDTEWSPALVGLRNILSPPPPPGIDK